MVSSAQAYPLHPYAESDFSFCNMTPRLAGPSGPLGLLAQVASMSTVTSGTMAELSVCNCRHQMNGPDKRLCDRRSRIADELSSILHQLARYNALLGLAQPGRLPPVAHLYSSSPSTVRAHSNSQQIVFQVSGLKDRLLQVRHIRTTSTHCGSRGWSLGLPPAPFPRQSRRSGVHLLLLFREMQGGVNTASSSPQTSWTEGLQEGCGVA